MTKIRNFKQNRLRHWILVFGIYLGFGFSDLGFGFWDLEFGFWDLEF